MTALAVSFPTVRQDRTRAILFGLFFASGFCGLLYQVIWLRMAFAHFGIITPVLSVVVSVFMLGLGVGSLLAGRWGAPLCRTLGCSPATLYGLAELLIGVGAFAVPAMMGWSEQLLLASGAAGSTSYLVMSALAITLTILPWCVLMGATFPLMMGYLKSRWPGDATTFSFLYRANVIGAAMGTLVSACILVEMLGFRATSLLAALVNVLIAAVSFALARSQGEPGVAASSPVQRAASVAPVRDAVSSDLTLFVTGFSSLGMEVVWTRGFTIVLQTTIYAFALILATYLIATAFGAALYRRGVSVGRVPGTVWLLLAAALAACLPVLVDDARVQTSAMGVLLSIVPFCLVLGFLTPKLIDTASAGDPTRAGRSYAVNILGSILGPLVAGYGLVTYVDIRVCMLLLALPVIGMAAWAVLRSTADAGPQRLALGGCLAVLLFGAVVSRSYEGAVFGEAPHVIHRDHVATAIAFGEGMQKRLLVNGVGITALTPVTKIMAHLPLAVQGQAHDGLVICFGMGTTMRAMASWGIDTTVVELTRSVVDSFDFFHADAAAVLARPNVHVVVDDGRRFLARTDRSFDVIAIDPPPPIEAAGSSLLYSREMYEVLKRRLRPNGILQQWFPGGEDAVGQAVARTLVQSFPYVVAYRSIENAGVHFLASMQPIPDITADTFVSRLPDAARRDLVEWGPAPTPEAMATAILARRVPLADVVADPQGRPTVSDDHPFNEYFLLRRSL